MHEKLNTISGQLLDIFFPPACPVCGNVRPYSNGERLRMCTDCRDRLKFISGPTCLKCGKGLEEEEAEYCYDCQRHAHIYDRSFAVYEYTDAIKNSIYRFKYKNRREYASIYAEEIAERLGESIRYYSPDAIIPVPLHKSKYRQRGFNQAELIAVELGKILNIYVDTETLIRVKKTIPMKELNNKERQKNLESAFNVITNVVKYRQVLVVDDIYTIHD